MNKEIIELKEDLSASPLYSEDLAPVPKSKRTWNTWNLVTIWVGMAVCVPTYLLAAQMIESGLLWYEALIIIGLANLIITIPMVLNGHAGVKYGIPFPVLGRSSFGINGIHIPSVVRAIVACGWFGIQTWIGGLALYAIWNAITGGTDAPGLSIGEFVSFGLFWLINVYFIWKGTESIKWLEEFSAPILIAIGILLIAWGAYNAGGIGVVLDQSKQLGIPTAQLSQQQDNLTLNLYPIRKVDGSPKVTSYQLSYPTNTTENQQTAWLPFQESIILKQVSPNLDIQSITSEQKPLEVQFRQAKGSDFLYSSKVVATQVVAQTNFSDKIWSYLLWLTGMVGFWATMSLSIADITRYASTQKQQVAGQFIGLPGTMVLYSFVGIFVTCAAVINFPDILISKDAPWDPVSLLARFESPYVVVIAQIFMIIATLSTNIAANVIAPANAFSNLAPQKISFRTGGLFTAIIGIIICPWWLMGDIISALVFVSGLLGPVLGVLLCDYYFIKKKNLDLDALYKPNGIYKGFNTPAMIALFVGVVLGIIGAIVPSLDFLYKLSWFTGFAVSFFVYYILSKRI